MLNVHHIIALLVKKNISGCLPLYLKNLQNITSVLDIGCGNGMQVKLLMHKLPKVKFQCLDVGNFLWPENKDLAVKVYDGLNIPFEDESFDASLLFFTLHHASQPQKLLNEAIRVSKKKVLIFEEVYSNVFQHFFMIIYDLLVNGIIFGASISLPSFFTSSGLKRLFTGYKLKQVTEKVLPRFWLYPPRRVFYILEK